MSEKNTWRVVAGGFSVVIGLLIYVTILVHEQESYDRRMEEKTQAIRKKTIEKIDRIMHADRN